MSWIFIGGFLDGLSHIVQSYQKEFQKQYPDIKTYYFEWHEKKKIKACLEKIKDEKNIVGHSYGATTAISLLQEHEVDLLITIDPVSRFSTHKKPKAKRWIDVNAKPSAYHISDVIASIGGKWGERPQEDADEYYEVVTNHAKFGKMLDRVLMT